MCDTGFVKAQSDNLPKVSTGMIADYFINNECFNLPESSGIKMKRSERVSYGDSAVGYVQVKREGIICIVQGKICPEHRVNSKTYIVKLTVDEGSEDVQKVQCQDCAASEGGCKHAIAFLMWVHRRSEEPEPTATVCYWKKPRLAQISANVQSLKAKDLVKTKCIQVDQNECNSDDFLSILLQKFKSQLFDYQLSRHCVDLRVKNPMSMYEMMISFYSSDIFTPNADSFLAFASSIMTLDLCRQVVEDMNNQSECKLWKELRYGRVTASRLHDMAHCIVSNGSLVNLVLGNTKIMDTQAMRRGRNLEKKVLRVLDEKHNLNLSSCDLLLNPEIPVIGASPDAVGEDFVVEIKCPTTSKSEKNYIKSDKKLGSKCFAQIQLQMFLRNVQKGLFCMAKHDFEKTKEIEIIWVEYDQIYIQEMIDRAMSFWKNNIFPQILKSVTG